MSTVAKKTVKLKLNGREVSAPEGTVILDVAKRNGVPITNLCSHRNLKPFAACRTCMVEVRTNGHKELVYSCTHPAEDGMEVFIDTEETRRYNKACLEMLLVEHPLDCPICDKSGVCPLQDTTDAMQLYNNRFEIRRRNEPSVKTNPFIEFYLNRCITCGMCVRVCDEVQGVQALDFHKRGLKVSIGTANEEPLDCEFCGQCITVCPTGALMDLTSEARGLAALFTETLTTCNFCSWGCSIKLESKKGHIKRIEAEDRETAGINNGNLCAKGRFGHGMIHNPDRLKTPLMNVGGTFKEVTWDEALNTIAERIQTTVNRSGPETVAGLGSEKLTNEENYLFQKLFRTMGSNQVTNLQNLRAPYVNRFMLSCFENGIVSKPIAQLEQADVVLIFNSDLPSEFPVAGNAVRKAAVHAGADIIIANPRDVVFHNESRTDIRLNFGYGSDLAVVNRICKILIERKLINEAKVKSSVPNYDEMARSLDKYTADFAEKTTGTKDEVLTRAAERFARKADRFVIVGNDVLENEQGEDVLNALLNLCTLAHFGGEGSVSVYPPREHCNSQGVNDMGVTPEFLPGYRCSKSPEALAALAGEWGLTALKFADKNPADQLFENCKNGTIKFLYIAGEDPVHSYYKGTLVQDALRTVPFLVVQDIYMTETAKMADLILPTATYAEKDGSFTNMSRHVQRVTHAILPEGSSKPDFDIFIELAEALKKPFANTSTEDVQREIERVAPIYKGLLPGDESMQWVPQGMPVKPKFAVSREYKNPSPKPGYPFRLLANNHMFHIGTYTQYAKALVTAAPDCHASINPEDAGKLDLQTGDRIVVESPSYKIEAPVEVSPATARGMVYIPKNWPEIPVNLLRNGEEGPVSVKIFKAG
ncbi:MAG: molybdopterin-dependent oxidoreductase [Nitrospinae bacterium]|nr:molybdopterin-dependent oxidoreductase [Nitrospinota bacterium]